MHSFLSSVLPSSDCNEFYDRLRRLSDLGCVMRDVSYIVFLVDDIIFSFLICVRSFLSFLIFSLSAEFGK